MFNKNIIKNKNQASRITNWETVAHGIVQMVNNSSDLSFLISEIRRQFADKQRLERDLKKQNKSKKAGLKQQQMAEFLVRHPTQEQEREQFLAQMESQGFDRTSFENARKTAFPESILPTKEKPAVTPKKRRGIFNGRK